MALFSRRSMICGVIATSAAQGLAKDVGYAEYPYVDLFKLGRGPHGTVARDVDQANLIVSRLDRSSSYKIMGQLVALTDRGSTGELFNHRWKTRANPLIVKFFHDIGYSKSSYPDDCTPWCAATLAFTLKRAGHQLPRDPASSQSYLRYGTEVDERKVATGDICVFTDVADAAHGHVGFYVSQTPDTVTIIGGNQSGVNRTDCGVGFRASSISQLTLPKNARRDPKVDVHYFAKFVRPA